LNPNGLFRCPGCPDDDDEPPRNPWDDLPRPVDPPPFEPIDPPEQPPIDPPIEPDPPVQPDPLTKSLIDRLTKCVKDLYGVTLTSIRAAKPGELGIFEGTGFDRHRRGGSNGGILVTTDTKSFSMQELANMSNSYAQRYPDRGHPTVKPGELVLGATFSNGLALFTPVTPYTNYLANDPPADFNSNSSYLRRQIHELGHSLSDITGRGSGERGKELEECVFGKPFSGFR